MKRAATPLVLTALERAVGATSRQVARVELLVCKLMIALFTGLLVANVTLRYGLNSPLYFAEELAVFILIWMAFLAISVSLREDTQIRLTLLTDALPRRARRVVLLTMDALVAAMLAVILVHAVGWIRSPAVDFELALTLNMPKWPFYAIIPLFSGAGLVHVSARLLASLSEWRAA